MIQLATNETHKYQIMLDLTITKPNEVGSIQDFSKYVLDFLNNLDIKENSRATYSRALKQFFLFYMNNASDSIERAHVLAYKNYLKDLEYAAYTITSYLVVVRKFFEWLESKKIYPNIARSIKGMQRPKGFRKECLTTIQIQDILKGIERTTLRGKRDYAIINILLRTGARTIELQRTNIEDVRQGGAEAMLYVQGKGRDSKDSFVILTQASLKPLYEYLGARGILQDKSPLFASISDRNNGERITTRSISRIVKEALRNTGLNSSKLTAHSLRHTAITTALLAGASLQEVKEMARHNDINTTLIYSHNIDRVKNAPERKIDSFLEEVSSIQLVS